jgi:hypothetical protein
VSTWLTGPFLTKKTGVVLRFVQLWDEQAKQVNSLSYFSGDRDD